MIPSFSEWAQTQGLKRIEEMLSSSPGGNSKILSSSWIFTNIDENVNLNEGIVNEDVVNTELITTIEELKILQDSSTITSSKKKKKKKPRKKKLEGSTESIIKWGNVEEILFSRSYSFNSIPSNGAFPLGLGMFLMQLTFHFSILTIVFLAIQENQRTGTFGHSMITPLCNQLS